MDWEKILSPSKITLDTLNRDYKDFEGESIPFRRLGFDSLESFLRSIPDTLRVSGKGCTASVFAVANEKSQHIHKMVMEQKKPNVAVRCRPRQMPPRYENRRNYNNFQTAWRPMGQPFRTTNGNVSSNTVGLNGSLVNRSQFRPNTGCYHNIPSTPSRNLSQALQQAGIGIQSYLNKTHIKREPIASVETLVKQNSPQVKINPFKAAETAKIIVDGPKKCEKDLIQFEEPLNLPSSSSSSNEMTTASSASLVPKKVTFSLENKTEIKGNPCRKYTKEALLDIKANTKKETVFQQTQPQQSVLNDRAIDLLNRTEATKQKTAFQQAQPQQSVLNDRAIDLLNRTEATMQTERMHSSILAAEHEYDINVNQFKELLDISDTKLPNIGAAVPEFAVDTQVCRLDFPNYTVHFGRKIPSYQMPDNVVVGSCVGIFIAEIHNPFKFWFHIYKEEHELDLLMDEIEQFYKSLEPHELVIPDMCLVPGQVCAAIFKDLWHRAEIVAPVVNNKVKVFFVDYGTVALVSVMEIKMLVSCFADLPAQAMRACLSHIKPLGQHWSYGATMHFLQTAADKMLYAKITEIDRENMIYYMILCDTYGDEVIQLNKELVGKGFALYNKDWKEKHIIQNNGSRNHHPCEDYPTFSMIESGNYPTFSELFELYQCGIDYEWIYDRILMNKSTILNFQENAPDTIRDLPFFLLTSNPFRTDILFELAGLKNSKG